MSAMCGGPDEGDDAPCDEPHYWLQHVPIGAAYPNITRLVVEDSDRFSAMALRNNTLAFIGASFLMANLSYRLRNELPRPLVVPRWVLLSLFLIGVAFLIASFATGGL